VARRGCASSPSKRSSWICRRSGRGRRRQARSRRQRGSPSLIPTRPPGTA
jgi:hypothetical protein